MEEWKSVHIGDLGTIVTGKTPKTSIEDNYGGDTPFLSPSDDLSGKYVPITGRTLSNKGVSEVKNCLLPPQSVCVSCIGSDLGKSVITRCNTITNQQFNSIIPSNGFDTDFVYYAMQFVGPILNALSKTSTAVPIINKSTFSSFQIRVPDYSTQCRISRVLSALDDKIELNNRINHNLEAQAQALYKSWFVDFEPFKGLDFIDSDLGMIPSSLKIKQISTVKHILETGKRPKGGVGDLSFGIPSIGAESIKGLGFFDSSKVKYISEDFARTLKKGWIDGYELLIYKDGGKPGYFIPNYNIFGEGFPYNRMCLNEHVFKLDFLDRGLNAFAYFYFHSEYVFNYLNAQGGKAAIPGINQKDIESLWIFDPNNEHVRLFSERVSPLITTILNNCRCNMELAKTRDMLLPKLMSGELKINDLTC